MQVGTSICNLLKYLKKYKEISIQKKKNKSYFVCMYTSLYAGLYEALPGTRTRCEQSPGQLLFRWVQMN